MALGLVVTNRLQSRLCEKNARAALALTRPPLGLMSSGSLANEKEKMTHVRRRLGEPRSRREMQ